MCSPTRVVGVTSLALAVTTFCGALVLFFSQTIPVYRGSAHPSFLMQFTSGWRMLAGVITLALVTVAFVVVGLYALRFRKLSS